MCCVEALPLVAEVISVLKMFEVRINCEIDSQARYLLSRRHKVLKSLGDATIFMRFMVNDVMVPFMRHEKRLIIAIIAQVLELRWEEREPVKGRAQVRQRGVDSGDKRVMVCLRCLRILCRRDLIRSDIPAESVKPIKVETPWWSLRRRHRSQQVRQFRMSRRIVATTNEAHESARVDGAVVEGGRGPIQIPIFAERNPSQAILSR